MIVRHWRIREEEVMFLVVATSCDEYGPPISGL